MSHEPYPGERPSTSRNENPYDADSGHQGQGSVPYQPGPSYQQQYQQPYPPAGYQPGYHQPSYSSMEGEKAAQLSLIFGIVGFFVAGIVLGPLAIWQASKAEAQGVSATAGKILGWIVTVLNVLAVIGVVVVCIILFAGLSASGGYGT